LKDVSLLDLSQPFIFFGLAVVVSYFFIQFNAIFTIVSSFSAGWHELLLKFCAVFERNQLFLQVLEQTKVKAQTYRL
jgi:hypothetical protein